MGFVDLFESLLGLGVTRINVRMVLASQFTERSFDLFFAGILADTERLIIVSVFHSQERGPLR